MHPVGLTRAQDGDRPCIGSLNDGPCCQFYSIGTAARACGNTRQLDRTRCGLDDAVIDVYPVGTAPSLLGISDDLDGTTLGGD